MDVWQRFQGLGGLILGNSSTLFQNFQSPAAGWSLPSPLALLAGRLPTKTTPLDQNMRSACPARRRAGPRQGLVWCCQLPVQPQPQHHKCPCSLVHTQPSGLAGWRFPTQHDPQEHENVGGTCSQGLDSAQTGAAVLLLPAAVRCQPPLAATLDCGGSVWPIQAGQGLVGTPWTQGGPPTPPPPSPPPPWPPPIPTTQLSPP